MQQPNSLTRFLCWNFPINITSYLNSSIPCLELLESLFIAICCPFDNWPWNHDPNLSLLITIILKQQSSICFYNREWTTLILAVRSVRMTLNRVLISFSSILWQEQSGTLLVGVLELKKSISTTPKISSSLSWTPPHPPPPPPPYPLALQMSSGLYLWTWQSL